MNPGKLDRRIQFLNVTQVEQADYDYVLTYTPITQLQDGMTWAHVRSTYGSRQLQAGEPVITDTTHFIIRYRPDFTPSKEMRILYRNSYYIIHGLLDMKDESRFWEIVTKVTDSNSDKTN